MTTISNLFRTLAVAAFAATLSACTTTPVAPPPVPKMAELLSQASQAATLGDKEKAVTLWKQTATIYPTEKTPWVNITQTRYDSGKYAEAIISAEEILVRDPANTFANSIIATAGLRLSTRALADLSRQSNLTGSVKSEAQDLAKLLRESLGENVLFAANGKAAADDNKVIKKPGGTIIKKPKPEPDAKGGDPFILLKQ